MRIAIDARALSWAGIGRYTRNLLREYRDLNTEHDFLVLISPHDEKEYRSEFDFEYALVSSSYYSLAEQTVFLRQLHAIDADLFHFMHFNVPILFKGPYLVTIHDATRFLFPGQTSQSLLKQVSYELVFQNALRKAREVVYVSQSTRDEVVNLLHGPSGVVIYEGVDEVFLEPIEPGLISDARTVLGFDGDYILYVGVWMGHKNLERLLRAFALLENENVRLVITGEDRPGYVNIPKMAEWMGLGERVVFPGFVPHELLPAIYSQARLFVYPSLYEGFGLPPLEALATGTPVVTSNVSSMPEILGGDAIYVNPESVEDIAYGIARGLQADFVEFTQKYSWRLCAEQTIRVYGGVN